jgi:hypothetical protein
VDQVQRGERQRGEVRAWGTPQIRRQLLTQRGHLPAEVGVRVIPAE